MVIHEDYSDADTPRSPGLQKVEVHATPDPSPPPFVPRQVPMPDSPDPDPRGRRKRTRTKYRPSQGDVVLLGHMDPNRPDIARAAGPKSYNTIIGSERSSSVPSSESSNDDDTMSRGSSSKGTTSGCRSSPPVYPNGHAMPRHNGFSSVNGIGRGASENSIRSAPITETTTTKRRRRSRSRPDIERLKLTGSSSDAFDHPATDMQRPQPGSGGAAGDRVVETVAYLPTRDRDPLGLVRASDSLSSSPKLRAHMLTASQASPKEKLPALQPDAFSQSTTTVSSPRNDQQLPSIGPLIDAADHDLRAYRPRTSSVSSVTSASTFGPPTLQPAHTMPPALPPTPLQISHPSRSYTEPSSIERSSLYYPTHSRNPSSTTQRTLAHSYTSPLSGTSMTSGNHATPSSTSDSSMTPRNRSATLPSYSPPNSNQPQSSSSGAAGLYHCQHPGCHAAPFQTQYLLNSHANVHSSERPHFCPVKTCPRSEGGKGFKRKNEMLRHGLVHSSPGYVCPYCSDKEHRYPRPDNLQRHVRMHHPKQDAEDPRLREVLDQRRVGGHPSQRGRRRRT